MLSKFYDSMDEGEVFGYAHACQTGPTDTIPLTPKYINLRLYREKGEVRHWVLVNSVLPPLPLFLLSVAAAKAAI